MLKQLVFVYGTLREGFRNHRVMQGIGAEKIGAARTMTRARLYNAEHGGFPLMVLDRRGMQVHGEVYAVDRRGVAILDGFENAPHLYRRVKVRVKTRRRVLAAWAYVWAATVDGEQEIHPDYERTVPREVPA
jgi:gamma-glutamylaminecyclotransferase